jgi:hypothetical protein
MDPETCLASCLSQSATSVTGIFRGLINASPSNTRVRSRMRESLMYGFVRGSHSDMPPYRDPWTMAEEGEVEPPEAT